jgi:hypothetical protein
MATYNFTGANGAPLPSGLSAQNAPLSTPTASTFEIQSNSLAATAVPNPSGAVFYETSGGTADDDISLDVTLGASGGAGSTGLAFRQTDGDNYLIAFINPSGAYRLFSNVAGSFTQIGTTYTIAGFNRTTTYTIRVVFSGTSITCYLDGVSRVTGTSSVNQTATRHGARLADTFVRLDDFITTSSVTNSIAIDNSTPNNYVFQRNASNQFTASFSVSYTGTPASLEYQLYDASDDSIVTSWTVFDASPAAGASSLNITLTAATTQYYAAVRHSDNIGVTSTQANVWAVGIKALLIGQSLAQHLSTQDTAAALTGYYYYDGSTFAQPTIGAGQRALAEALINTYSCAVALTNTAIGGTCLSNECAISRGDGTNYWANPSSALYSDTLTRYSGFAADDKVEFILWIQGQTDAVVAVSDVDYTSALTTLIAQVRSDFLDKSGGTSIPIVMGTLGRNTSTGSDATAQVIREAILTFIEADALILPLPIYTQATDDGTHPDDAGDLKLGTDTANLYASALAPTVSSLAINGAGTVLTLTFDSDLEAGTSYSTEGVRVVSASTVQTIAAFDRTGIRTADVTLSAGITDKGDIDLFLSWGTGSTSALLTYPTAASSDALVTIPLAMKAVNLNQSTLNITVTNTPDGTYKTIITNPSDDSIVFAGNLAYSSGAATTGSLSLAVSTALTGFVIDNEATHVNGAVITGTTV